MKLETEDCRQFFAEAIIQIYRDLQRPVVSVEWIDKHAGQRQFQPWFVYVGERIATFSKYIDDHGAHVLSVPSFRQIVDLWATDMLNEHNIVFGRKSNLHQRQINQVFQQKLDSIFIEGDPYLTAWTVNTDARNIRLMMHYSGLSESKINDAVDKLAAMAENLTGELLAEMAKMYQPQKNLLLQLDLTGYSNHQR